jgi:phosphate transport system permease protein
MEATQVISSGQIQFREKIFKRSLSLAALVAVSLLALIFLTLLVGSLPSIRSLGISFFYGKIWDPVSNKFGGLPFLAGTLMTSFLALLLSAPFSIAVALFLGEYYRKGPVAAIFKQLIDLLAGIPSVIYGFWGLFVLVPIVRGLELRLHILPYGVGVFTSGVILAIMITPFSVSLSRQVITMVPAQLKEAAYCLGATRYEVIRFVVLPFTRSGLFAGILLALGRALGETMAVTMLIGNTHSLPAGLFGPGNTMASVIANEFTEATGIRYTSALIEMGLFLFIVATIINIIGKQIIKRFTL